MSEEAEKDGSGGGSADLDRRRFIKFGTTSLAVAGLGACVFGIAYISPNVLYEPSPVVSAGKPEHYPVDSVTLDLLASIFVVHAKEGFYALSAVCTHLGCLSVWKPDAGVIACPCHGSSFRRDGTVIAGPAPRPLPWLKMWMGEDGSLRVDRSTLVAANEGFVRV
jgi:cytochrome b6-f complex iron-sulfur subunit